MRDGVSHCEYLNSDEICKLLFLFVQFNVVYTYSYCHLTNKDINIIKVKTSVVRLRTG